VLLFFGLAACGKRAPAPAENAVASASPIPEPVVSARRPSRRYLLARTPSRCETFFVDPDRVSPKIASPCPPDLDVGEHIRIVGRTCIREVDLADHDAAADDRRLPVVCPDTLTDLEKRERGERGERGERHE
jgi:hypothetical protein